MKSFQDARETVYNEIQSNTTFHCCYDAVHVKQNSLLDTDTCLEPVPGVEICQLSKFLAQDNDFPPF